MIAETDATPNLEAIRAGTMHDPGTNFEIGLALGEFAAAFGGHRPPVRTRLVQVSAGA